MPRKLVNLEILFERGCTINFIFDVNAGGMSMAVLQFVYFTEPLVYYPKYNNAG